MIKDDTILSVKNLTVNFGDNLVLNDVSFSVKKGETFVIIGPNGAGKSVLFRTLLGLIPHKGKVEWKQLTRKGYVPQKLSVSEDFPLTVEEFLQLSPPENPRDDILSALNMVGFRGDEHHLERHLLGKKIGKISSGELQRVLIALAILDKPDVLLFDEPTSGIDIGAEAEIYERLEKLKKETGYTLFLISHDLSIVHRWATNVLCLNRKVICVGSPETVVESNILKELYGSEKAIYKHEHRDET